MAVALLAAETQDIESLGGDHPLHCLADAIDPLLERQVLLLTGIADDVLNVATRTDERISGPGSSYPAGIRGSRRYGASGHCRSGCCKLRFGRASVCTRSQRSTPPSNSPSNDSPRASVPPPVPK